MKIPSFTQLFNQLLGKTPVNDNTRFDFTVSDRQKKRALDAPLDNSIVEEHHGLRVADPFRPLENIDAPETLAWADRQNARFEKFITGADKSITSVTEFLRHAWDHDSSGLPGRYGDKYFRSFHKALTAQSRLEIADSADGPWQILVDPNTMSADGTVALSGWSISADGKRIILLTSQSGSDVQTLQIMDTATGQLLADKIENCRFASILWDKNSPESFQYTYPTHDGTKRHIIKHHTIGQDTSTDPVIFSKPEENSFVYPERLRTGKYEWIGHYIGTSSDPGILFRPTGSQEDFTQILPPHAYKLDPISELADGTVLAVTTESAPRGRVVRFDPYNPAPENWTEIIPQHAEDVMESAVVHKEKLFGFYTHDTADAVRVFTQEGQHLHDMPLPEQSIASFARINKDDDSLTLKISGFKSAGDVYSYDIATNRLDFVKKGDAVIDLNDCIVERLYATSKDGTKVPMTVIRAPETELDGTAAVKLYGYGGFNNALTPGFSTVTAQFVRAGGIYVQANLRGGGEFGKEWYDQGRGANKQNVFDDFIACAEHLIGNKYTSPARLVINGASNGGLLTSATMLQRPDLFGAVVTEVAVTDMFRYHLATYGSAWKPDYGDPGVKADFNRAAAYSPLHNVKEGAAYPPHLIMTADHDDRVMPWHSYKLAATLQARSHKSNITLLRVEKDAGHGAGKPTAKIVKEEAEVFAFIERAIGPVDQKAYKAKIAADIAMQMTLSQGAWAGMRRY